MGPKFDLLLGFRTKVKRDLNGVITRFEAPRLNKIKT